MRRVDDLPRMPWGYAKRILSSMAIGESKKVRVGYLQAFQSAARLIGITLHVSQAREDPLGNLIHTIRRTK